MIQLLKFWFFDLLELLEFFWQWSKLVLTTMILSLRFPPLGQIDIEALVEGLVQVLVEMQLVEVVHVHVAAVAQHLVIDHGVKLHFQPPCNFDMGMSIWPFSTKTKVPYQTYNLTNFAFGGKSQNDIPMH